jgi:hypothetical protein
MTENNQNRTEIKKCWASSIGGCSEKLSREHVISKSVLPEGELVVEGYPGLPFNTAVESNLIAKILCTAHNNALSPTDSEASKLKLIAEHSRVAKEPSIGFVNGKLIELWLLKTYINRMVSGWLGFKLPPSLALVEAAFGIDDIPFPCGLHTVGNFLWRGDFDRGTDFRTTYRSDKHTGEKAPAYFFLIIDGIPFWFSLGPPNLLHASPTVTFYDQTVREFDVRRHPSEVHLTNDEGVQTTISFRWDLGPYTKTDPRSKHYVGRHFFRPTPFG